MDHIKTKIPSPPLMALSRFGVGNLHCSCTCSVNKGLHVPWAVSQEPFTSTKLTKALFKRAEKVRKPHSPGSITNHAVYILYCDCGTKIILGWLCQSLWAHKSEMFHAGKWLYKLCCNTATRD